MVVDVRTVSQDALGVCQTESDTGGAGHCASSATVRTQVVLDDHTIVDGEHAGAGTQRARLLSSPKTAAAKVLSTPFGRP